MNRLVPRWMARFTSRPVVADATRDDTSPALEESQRGGAAVATGATLQNRVARTMSLALGGALSIGFLLWYYSHAFNARAAESQAPAHAKPQIDADSALPPLTVPRPAATTPTPSPATAKINSAEPQYLIGSILGPAPASDGLTLAPDAANLPRQRPVTAPTNVTSSPGTRTPEDLRRERQLGGTVFVRSARAEAIAATLPTESLSATPDSPANLPAPGQGGQGAMARQLTATATPAVSATTLPTRRLLLPKGSSIDCTLITAIDSTLPGLTTCLTAVDTFSADGSVVLLERGTLLIGETAGNVQQGSARVFVLWTEARTPNGIVIPLASPGTDELGRSGLPGKVDRHFWDRFGAAILLSTIDSATLAIANNQDGGGTSVVLNPRGTRDIATEVLRNTINIPPTIKKRQGDRIAILVARDLDFRSVYSLQARRTE